MSRQRGETCPRLLMDVTIAATTDLNTGIQRVVRNISRHAEAVSDELGIECIPVVCHGDQLSAVGFDGRPRLDERIVRGLSRSWMSFHKAIARGLSRWSKPASEKYLAGLSRLRKLLVPKTLVRNLGNNYRKITGQLIQLREKDVLVLLDASWDLQLRPLLEVAQTRNVSVVTVIYDLIPILYPQFHPDQLRNVFSSWFETVLKHSDLMIGISRTVRDDLKPLVRQRIADGLDACALDWFQLGADFITDRRKSDDDLPARSASKLAVPVGSSPYYLSVGTVEPRKNHAFLLDAFEQLWKSGSNAKLVIVGKIGWMCEEVAERIRQHPQIDRNLFFADQVDDQQLSDLYAQAKALVFPSIVEGFGLPIVEAFQHRTPVLASDTRIHREVAGNNALYFELSDASKLAQLMQQIETGQRSLPIPSVNWWTWQESCRDFLSKVKRFVDLESTSETVVKRSEAA